MYRVKIFGAGSIGNHLANAARAMDWDVVVCDINTEALRRMREEIYPARYGAWDPGIELCLNNEAPRGGFDLIFIGTPPDHHLNLAMRVVEERPKAIVIEKPVCVPSLEHAQALWSAMKVAGVKGFVGYDHVVGAASSKVDELVRAEAVGPIETMEVEFREHWQGIFAAHSWLSGPQDTYLGFWQRGGGASGEHSHGLNLWQHFAHVIGAGRVVEVNGMLQYQTVGKAHFDRICQADLRTETGFTGRVVQDVVSLPVRKRARLFGKQGTIEWVYGYNGIGDAVIVTRHDAQPEEHIFPKKRPDDFIREMKHVHAQLSENRDDSPISLERGLDTMLVVAAIHQSEAEQRRVRIAYDQGYSLQAIRY